MQEAFEKMIDCQFGHAEISKKSATKYMPLYAFSTSDPNSALHKAQMEVARHMIDPKWAGKASASVAGIPGLKGVDPNDVHPCFKDSVIAVKYYPDNIMDHHAIRPKIMPIMMTLSQVWKSKGANIDAATLQKKLVDIVAS